MQDWYQPILEAASAVPVVVEGFEPTGAPGVAVVVVIVGLLLKQRRSASTPPALSNKVHTKETVHLRGPHRKIWPKVNEEPNTQTNININHPIESIRQALGFRKTAT